MCTSESPDVMPALMITSRVEESPVMLVSLPKVPLVGSYAEQAKLRWASFFSQ